MVQIDQIILKSYVVKDRDCKSGGLFLYSLTWNRDKSWRSRTHSDVPRLSHVEEGNKRTSNFCHVPQIQNSILYMIFSLSLSIAVKKKPKTKNRSNSVILVLNGPVCQPGIILQKQCKSREKTMELEHRMSISQPFFMCGFALSNPFFFQFMRTKYPRSRVCNSAFCEIREAFKQKSKNRNKRKRKQKGKGKGKKARLGYCHCELYELKPSAEEKRR